MTENTTVHGIASVPPEILRMIIMRRRIIPVGSQVCKAWRAQITEVLAEYKYDGQRVQAHFDPDQGCRLYSRHLEDTTVRLGDAAAAIATAAKGVSFIIDAEVRTALNTELIRK